MILAVVEYFYEVNSVIFFDVVVFAFEVEQQKDVDTFRWNIFDVVVTLLDQRLFFCLSEFIYKADQSLYFAIPNIFSHKFESHLVETLQFYNFGFRFYLPNIHKL